MKVPTLVAQRTSAPNLTREYSRASAVNMTAGLSQALVGLGAALEQRQEKTERFGALRQLSEFDTEVQQRLVEAQRNAPPDGQGFAPMMTQEYERLEQEFLSGRIPPSMREEFAFRTSQIKQGVVTKALDFQYKAGDVYFRQGISDEYEKARAALDPRLGGDPTQLELMKATLGEVIATSDLSEIEKNELLRKTTMGLESVGYRAAIAKGGAIGQIDDTVGAVIDQAAERYGEDARTLRTIAWLESRGNPNAKNPNSSAGGLFQFIDGTAEQYGLRNKFDAGESADAGARLLRDNRAFLRKRLGREPSVGELYLAHQQGVSGAFTLLRNPDMRAADIVGAAAVRLNGGDMSMTAQEFANLWIRKAENVDADIDSNPAFANVPYEDRLALRQDATRDLVAQETAEQKAAKSLYESNLNSLLLSIHDGAGGQMDIDSFRQSNPGMAYSDLSKLNKALEDYGAGIGLAAATLGKITSGVPIDPTSPDDRKGMNAIVGKEGIARIGQADQEYFSNGIVPLVTAANDIPTDVVGTLMGMLRSNNQTQSLFALDAFSQLQDADPRAFLHRVDDATLKDVQYWRNRRNVVPHDELLKQINPGVTQEERQARMGLRKEAEQVLAQRERGVPALTTLLADFVDDFGGWLSTAQTSAIPWAAQALQAEFQSTFIDEYERYGNVEEATESAKKVMKRSWATTTVGEGKLMKHPPELAGYNAYNGSFDWINEQVRQELALPEGARFELIGDGLTDEEVGAFKRGEGHPPSYLIAVQMPGEGFFRVQERRMWFKVSDETRAKDAEALTLQSTMNQLTKDLDEALQGRKAGVTSPEDDEEIDLMLEEYQDLMDRADKAGLNDRPNQPWFAMPGFSIGPVYPFWDPETAADAKIRKMEIDRAAKNSENRIKEKKKVREQLMNMSDEEWERLNAAD